MHHSERELLLDARERANLHHKHADVFERPKRQWQCWNEGFLPITDAVFAQGVTSDRQADRYAPDGPTRVHPAA